MKWSVEPATHGLGRWFVGRGEHGVEVIAAPGTPIPAAESEPWGVPPRLAGWRYASWPRELDKPLNIDRDPPEHGICLIVTREVLALIDDRLHETVRRVLEDQLAQLEAMDLLPGMTQDPEFEQAAHRELMAIAWLRSEMADAFPERYPHYRQPVALVTTARRASEETMLGPTPKNVEELESQLRTTVYSRGLGGRELVRLLRRRIIWRSIKWLPRILLIVMFAISRDDGELHELVARWLTEQAFKSGWPLMAHLEEVRGRANRLLALGWHGQHEKAERRSVDAIRAGHRAGNG
jgi:hypothetical protein